MQLNPLQGFPTPYRAQEAAGASALAAWFLAFWNIVTAWFVYNRPRPYWTLVPKDPELMATVHLGVAAIAAVMAIVLHRWKPFWAYVVILVWSVAELVRPVTAYLYGHGAPLAAGAFTLVVALLGFRGKLAVRRFERQAPETEDAA